MQTAITAYTLVMAAFMLVGAKLGDILGRDRAFAIGLAVYGVGSLTTALSPNLAVLLVGWSLVEGLGAVLVIPAIAALTAANYEGKDRAFAYGDHRRRCAARDRGRAADRRLGDDELHLALRVRRRESWSSSSSCSCAGEMQPAPRPTQPPKLDVVGVVLSASGPGPDRVRRSSRAASGA